MFLKLNGTYYASLTVSDSSGNLIDNDTPTMTVYDIANNLYYNGLTWTSTEAELVMACVGNGIYQSQFVADKVGTFRVSLVSRNYEISSSEILEVYDSDVASYQWQTGSLYTVTYKSLTSDVPVCSVTKEFDGTYFNGTDWTEEYAENKMTKTDDSYAFSFIPDTESKYGITVKCGDSQFYYILEALSVAENIAPVLVSNQTLKSLDGSGSDVVDHKGAPISEATVTVFDISTKEVVGKTTTNYMGEWSLLLKPGKWQFLFEKQGYVSVGFERVVK